MPRARGGLEEYPATEISRGKSGVGDAVEGKFQEVVVMLGATFLFFWYCGEEAYILTLGSKLGNYQFFLSPCILRITDAVLLPQKTKISVFLYFDHFVGFLLHMLIQFIYSQ